MKMCVLGQPEPIYPTGSSLYKTFENRQLSSVLYQYFLGMLDSPLLEEVFDQLPVNKDAILEDGFFSFVMKTISESIYDSGETSKIKGTNLCQEIMIFDNDNLKIKHLKNVQFLLSTQTKEKKEDYFHTYPNLLFDIQYTHHYDLIELLLNEGALIKYVDDDNSYKNLFLIAIKNLDMGLVKIISQFLDLTDCKKGLEYFKNLEDKQNQVTGSYQMYTIGSKDPFIEKMERCLENICLTKKLENELPTHITSEKYKHKI